LILTIRRIAIEVIVIAFIAAVFVGPLLFVVFAAGKTPSEAASMNFLPPAHAQYWDNFSKVISASNYMLLRAFKNSLLLTGLSIGVLVGVSSLAGFVLDRRKTRAVKLANFLALVGLMLPPSVITTIWVLKAVALYKTLTGIVLVEVALGLPYTIILYRAFSATIPRELDEAALVEGATPFMLFSRIVFPLFKPVTATTIVLSSVSIFNDFVNPLYFFPGARNVTIPLTLYNFMTQYSTQWNLLFANVLLITIPPLVCFLFFNRLIVAGMTAGAVKA
jgi:raffinose/stachyose/melibiose transport system permease protein